jgi:hypothetical protein
MATKNRTKARSGRSALNREALENAIEDERARLMTIHSLLGCIAIAMRVEQGNPGAPHYLTLVEMARDMLDESIARLDSLALCSGKPSTIRSPLDEAPKGEPEDGLLPDKDEVREPRLKYGLN